MAMTIPLEPGERVFALSSLQAAAKRSLDLFLAVVLLVIVGWAIPFLAMAARYSTGQSGIFSQERIGLYGLTFTLYKLRTMRDIGGVSTTVTAKNDMRITRLGSIFRKWKLDELPQLFNVLNGSMSFVGPRPDVASAYKGLKSSDLIVLKVRPGITGPASLRFRNEEELFADVEDPEAFSSQVVFPEKLRINREYVESYSFMKDIFCILKTATGFFAAKNKQVQ